MNHLEKLNQYLKEQSDTGYYDVVRKLIKNRVTEMDRAVPKLLNKAFNHRYTISRIEKAKTNNESVTSENEPDYEAQLQDQYRQIKWIQEKMAQMKTEYNNLKQIVTTIHFLNRYHLEINSVSVLDYDKSLEEDLKAVSLKYLFNNGYELTLINRYTDGLKKEGLELWSIKSLDEIKIPT